MKKRRIFLAIATLILGLGIVSVSLSGSLRETLSKRTTPAATPVAPASDKSAQVTPARAETAPRRFLADPLDLERLTNNADLIIIGRINATSNGGRATATLAIDKVVKGEAETQTIDFQFSPNAPSATARIQPEVFGMFFLKRNEAGGGYRILDPTYPAVIAPANAVLSKEGGLERTVNVVGQVLLTARTAADRQVAVIVLSSARNARATELLRQGATDSDSVVKMQSISALLNRNDIETLSIAEKTLLNPPARTEPYLLDNISAALEGIKDPQAIPALQRLLRSSNERTRLGAIMALRQMHVMDAVDGLVIALGDHSREVRYESVIGLSELTRQNEWGPAIGSFEKDEQKYLDHWKEWARNR
ncbi:MAG TPA: HEAT repeat domain-containing protein [Pyrinomonadaceae bacterium]|nr:HEAT repeat domain-containing protein [Pyrinomonadaceae bacterium]